MPENMPDKMSDGMPENMPNRMSEDLPVTKCIDVMVGIIRNIFFSYLYVIINIYYRLHRIV
jgi:hypothetical protein